MSDEGPTGTRYRAFISYSHKDAVFAARLHRRLEGYVLPKRLNAGRRLTPIFKDREELPAAHDLSAQVRAALAASDCLIVVCSPDAAASPWVGKEIETFRSLHPGRPILAALVRGEPAEAFPPALSDGGLEPLAADFRKEGDGERLALLKLAAGMADVGVDQLVQRDAQRRLRGVMAVTAAALVAMVAMGVMMSFASGARQQAERERARAEGLVEFMLTDLREQLKGVGRLEVMNTVNARALAYYSGQSLDHLPADSLQRRARLLMAMGEDDAARRDLASAAAKFAEAHRITEQLLYREPDKPERIWAHGQSEFWRGYLAYLGPTPKSARPAFHRYLALSEKLVAVDAGNAQFVRELGFAHGNLCSVALAVPREPAEALNRCQAALDLIARANRLAPPTERAQLDLANRHAWLADAQYLSGRRDLARASRLKQQEIVYALRVSDPRSARIMHEWVRAQRSLSVLDISENSPASARARLNNLVEDLDELIRLDPDNQEWRELRQLVDGDFAALKRMN